MEVVDGLITHSRGHRSDAFFGLSSLDHRRLPPSRRRASVVEIERMLGLYRDLYRGFTVKHLHEKKLIEIHKADPTIMDRYRKLT